MIALLQSVGKTPVHVKKDVPGFVGNRLQHALWREAIAMVAEGICDAETVDTVVKASFGRRLAVLGPLENADLVGTDLTLDIHNVVLPPSRPLARAVALPGIAGRVGAARHEDGTRAFAAGRETQAQALRASVFSLSEEFRLQRQHTREENMANTMKAAGAGIA